MSVAFSRRGQVAPFLAMEMMSLANAQAAAGADIIHMEIGQPCTAAPRLARAAAAAALQAGDVLGYTEALGLAELRRGIAAWYRRRHGVEVPAERIVVTTGSSAAFMLAFIACFAAGQRVALAEPAYPAYRNILGALDLEAAPLPVGDEQRWQVSPGLVAGCNDAAGLLIASPANPTGTMLTADALAATLAACRARGITAIVDEIYLGIEYEAAPMATALQFSDDVFVVNSFSKLFSMTGWRIGWLVAPQGAVRALERLAQNLYISPPAISQVAALAALEAEEEVAANLAGYRRNRDIVLSGLAAAGLSRWAPPDGAFYVYVDTSSRSADSTDFCRRMLTEIGVAATPGMDFDPQRGGNYVRFSYAGAEADMAEAMRRLKAWRA